MLVGMLVEVGSAACGVYKETRMSQSRSDWTLKRMRVRKIKNFSGDCVAIVYVNRCTATLRKW